MRYCKICGKIINRKSEKGSSCWVCSNRKARQRKIEKIQSIVGKKCWFCGYDKSWAALDFHHIDKSSKQMGLSTREMQFTWSKILIEMKKCVLICSNCHRELHVGLISDEIVREKYLFWNKLS